MKLKVIGCVVYLALIIGLPMTYAQQTSINNYSVSAQGWWDSAEPPFSPVMHDDSQITFRIKAPLASKVDLIFGEWEVKPQPLQKDSTGNWQVTIGPVVPGIYSYLFKVDGVNVPDWSNPVVKTGTELYSSIVEVSGNEPRFDEIQDVQHGVLQTLHYNSSPLKQIRGLTVYLPYEYFSQPAKKFPVLYLRHGGGDNETSWSAPAGRAHIILENLLAQKKAEPLILVMTNGTWAGGSSKEGMEQLEEELLKDVIPLIERSYRTKPGSENRAIAGLSMGGGQAYIMGLRNLDKFGWIGQFSSGLLSDSSFDINERAPGVFKNSDQVNKQLRLLWIGCGKADNRYDGHLAMIEGLKKNNIQFEFHSSVGGHEWRVWREQLFGFLQKVFK